MDCFVRMLAAGLGLSADAIRPVLEHASIGSSDAFEQFRAFGLTFAELAAHGARVDPSGAPLLDSPVNVDRAFVAVCRVIWGRFGG